MIDNLPKNFHSLSVQQIFELFKTSFEGLNRKEIEKRIKEYGLNSLPEPKRLRRFEIFLSQFKNPLIVILLIAAIICLFLKDFKDFFIILAAVFLNTLIGYIQEEKAEEAVHKLRKMVEHKAKVIRNNEEHIISSFELVPGEIIILEAGDIILADARVVESHNLETIEAVLTGESKPSDKKTEPFPEETVLADRENMVYQGCIISRGKGLAVVVATGSKTEFGKIAILIKETKEEKTPLQQKMGHLAKTIGLVIVILALFLFFFGLLTGRDFLEMLLISVAVAVAGVPEGLVIAITVCLAIGMQRILKKKALVRKLIAAETLGSVTAICSDKTGTLTEGKMSVSEIYPFKSKDLALKIGFLCNNVIIENLEDISEKWIMAGDETEKALILGAVKFGLNFKKIREDFPRIDEIPFDSEKMWMATLHEVKISNFQFPISNFIIFIKGAPERILKMSKYIKIGDSEIELTEDKYKEIENKYLEFTKKGLRVLAMAYKIANFHQSTTNNTNISDIRGQIRENSRDLVFVGLIALKDPLRKEAKATINECQMAGIRPIIVTGDHKLTAKIIAQEIGLKDEKILEGSEIDQMSDQELEQEIERVNVFARVEPKHKIRIVDVLQAKGEVVAMTGDGVNDAPAIKSADIGIALGSGTDVTKETADIVLLDDNFKTIVEAVKEGRGIFDNIKKIVLYLLCNSFTEIILVSGALVAGLWVNGLPLPLLPAQILWINIIQDGPPAMALAYEKTSKEVMKEKPRGLKIQILNKQIKFLIFGISVIFNLVLFAFFIYFWQKTKNILYTQTMMFVAVGLTTMFYVFACKDLKKSIFQYNPFDNHFLNLSVGFGFLMFLMALYLPFFQKILRTIPLSLSDWLILIALGFANLLLIEFGKWLFGVKKHAN